jgi:hypothetical protein
MGLPEKFDERLKSNLGLRAVWLPGTEIALGDILRHEDGIFRRIANLSDFGVPFRSKKLGGNISLKFQARGVSSTLLQAGAEVDPAHIDAKAKAEFKIEFKSKNTYFIRTPELAGVEIGNLIKVGKALKGHPDWRYNEYFIASGVYQAKEFVFLGSQSKNKTIRFGGLGSAILEFLTLGASANVAKVTTSSVTVEIIGKGGPVAMNIARFKKDGQIR